MNILEDYQKEAIEKADKVIFDLSDNLIVGKGLYGAVTIAYDKMKQGSFRDAAKLLLNAARLYVICHNPLHKDWDNESYALRDSHRCFDEANVRNDELEKAIWRYMNFPPLQKKGSRDIMRIRNVGKPKKLVLLTRESTESANVAKRIYGFDKVISNRTRYKSNATINDVEEVIKRPEDKLSILEKEIGSITNAIVISSNLEDPELYKGKVRLFLSEIPDLSKL